MPNIALLNQVMEHIEAHPDQHTQMYWYAPSIRNCGTTACFAGWSILLHPETKLCGNSLYLPLIAGHEDLQYDFPGTAQELLGLSETEADWLFNAVRTREELRAAVDYWTILAELPDPPVVDVDTWFSPWISPVSIDELAQAPVTRELMPV